MTTGRINQVRTIGGARARRAPPARVRAPTRARAPQGPASRQAPSRFVGRHAASARSRRLRMPGLVSPSLGGACLRPARGPSCPCGVAPSGARSPAPGLRRPRLARPRPRLLLVHTFGAPAPPHVKPWRAPRYCQAAYCDSDEGVRPVGQSQRASPGTAAPTERHLQVTRRPPLASRPGPVLTRRRTGARIRTPHGRPPARAWLRRRAELAPWPPPEALPPCALRADPTRLPHTICSGTMRACENGGPPPLPFSGGEERPPPIPKWEGRREASSSSPPVFGRGGASGAQAGGPRPRPGSLLSAAHLRTGGEEQCTGTADTNPGCNYLVRGYSPSMHYFWRGDMPNFSPPLPFQPCAGARPRRARSGAPACAGLRQSPTPAAGASSTSAGLSGAPAGGGSGGPPTPAAGAPSTSAGQSGAPARAGLRWSLTPADGVPSTSAGQSRAPAHARRRRSPNPCGGRAVDLGPRGPSAAGRDRRNLKLARRTGRWPAEASAGPRRRRPCPIFTLLLILLTTPS